MPAATRRRMASRPPGKPASPDAPTTATHPARSTTGAHVSPDLATLVWDLTVYRLHQAFADGLAAPPATIHAGHAGTATSDDVAGLADVRLAATRHAVDDIREALVRIAAGSYSTCEGCAQPIAAQRLLAAPTTRWCPDCQADGCG
jgi:hypothetical protein